MIKNIFENTEGIYNITSSLGKTRKEIQVNVNHDKAALLGVNTQYISQTISSALFGFEVTSYSDGLDEMTFTDDDGDTWHTDEYGDRSYMWDYM